MDGKLLNEALERRRQHARALLQHLRLGEAKTPLPDPVAATRANMVEEFYTLLCGYGLMHTNGMELDEMALAEALAEATLPTEKTQVSPRVRVKATSRPLAMREAA